MLVNDAVATARCNIEPVRVVYSNKASLLYPSIRYILGREHVGTEHLEADVYELSIIE
jgi:hypothetical protein